nr:hypothetical protein [uncultured Acetobacter sp.]
MTTLDQTRGTPTQPNGSAEQPASRFAINWYYCLRCLLAQAILCPLGLVVLSLFGAVKNTSGHVSIPLFATAAILIAPPVETFIFFYLPYRLFRIFIKNQTWLWGVSFAVTILLFICEHHGGGGASPQRNWPMAINVGLISSVCFFGCFYLTAKSKRGSPFWTTVACHALYNTGVTAVVLVQAALMNAH